MTPITTFQSSTNEIVLYALAGVKIGTTVAGVLSLGDPYISKAGSVQASLWVASRTVGGAFVGASLGALCGLVAVAAKRSFQAVAVKV